jgi:hypothetical protein
MKINTEQLQRAITEYFNQEILAKASGWKKFSTALIFNMYKMRIPELVNNLSNNPLIKLTGVIDGNNFVDVETLYTHAKDAIQKSGQFELMGIIFTESDLDKLYSIIRSQNQIGGI